MIDRRIFSERLKMLKNKKKLKSVSIAMELGITKQSVYGWEIMKAVPTAEKLVELADLLDCSIDYLVGRTDNPKMNE